MKIILVSAITLDGKISKTFNHFPSWTGESDKKMFSSTTKCSGVIIMGAKTFELIPNILSNRKTIIMSRKLKKNIHKYELKNNNEPYFTDKSIEEIIYTLKKIGYQKIFICGGSKINRLFLIKNLVDELIITFSPFIFGSGLSILSENIKIRLKLKSAKLLDYNSILAKYEVMK